MSVSNIKSAVSFAGAGSVIGSAAALVEGLLLVRMELLNKSDATDNCVRCEKAALKVFVYTLAAVSVGAFALSSASVLYLMGAGLINAQLLNAIVGVGTAVTVAGAIFCQKQAFAWAAKKN